jgi:AIR synthase-related protein
MIEDRVVLGQLISFLRGCQAIAEKVRIDSVYAPAEALAGEIRVGDDCAAIPDGAGYLLFAAEGMLQTFVADDPWFAGYSAVMVNLSDIAAMGGRPIAVVDVLWTPSLEHSSTIWEGMGAASRAYGVPIVGGHTTITKSGAAFLAAAVIGRAEKLLTSFDARPGHDLLMAVDLRGRWIGEKPFWNASVGAPAARLQSDLALLPALAATELCGAGKDISNGGVIGTLAMLLKCSGVGAELWLDRIPRPSEGSLERWLTAFPSFGYLLSVPPKNTSRVTEHFTTHGIACETIGRITGDPKLQLAYGEEFMVYGL